MEYAFIMNPAAGTGFSVTVMEELESVLKQRGIAYRVLKTEYRGHATEIANQLSRDPDIIAVVSVGGDGTAFETACGLAGTGKPFGIIPAGTGNDFIKCVHIPKDPLQALELILNGSPTETDMGLLNDGMFLNVCGTGFDVTVLDYTESFKKRFRGLTPYLFGLIKSIFHYKPVHLKVEADGETTEGDFLVCSIANGQYIGGGIPICPLAASDDGLLDLVLIDNIPKRRIPLYLPGLLMGKDLSFKIARHQRVRSIKVTGEGMRLNVDGEIFPMDQAEFRIQPAAIMLYR